MEPLFPFAPTIINLCQDRQKMKPIDPEKAASDLTKATELINKTKSLVDNNSLTTDPPTALRAFRTITKLQGHLKEWFTFYNGYDPLFAWWLSTPYSEVDASLASLPPLLRSKLLGINPDDKDAIIGESIGREGLLADLSAEKIPYTPEELTTIAETEYTCLVTFPPLAADTWRMTMMSAERQKEAPFFLGGGVEVL
ncbi:hypothetical protein FQN50_006177 [Emmonsiellopsis sp. PD_5]|nr:hypothetical protein FQN50_006177 [Emmonsiellopsis sp. PD_5]